MDRRHSDQGVAQKAAGQYWRLPAGAELLWRFWDDEVIVYNTASGQTHLLDALSGATLKELEDCPRTIAELAGRLADRFDLDPDALSERLPDICAQFDKLGLAEPERS
ncbi:MAG: HPr-rel-A system PqqD family peptide chaperone [Kiloniellaceae bacterium]